MESVQYILITCPLRFVTLSICYLLATPMTEMNGHFSISAKSSTRFIAFITIYFSYLISSCDQTVTKTLANSNTKTQHVYMNMVGKYQSKCQCWYRKHPTKHKNVL